eukprot:5024548-Prymnesium_polylepis.2
MHTSSVPNVESVAMTNSSLYQREPRGSNHGRMVSGCARIQAQAASSWYSVFWSTRALLLGFAYCSRSHETADASILTRWSRSIIGADRPQPSLATWTSSKSQASFLARKVKIQTGQSRAALQRRERGRVSEHQDWRRRPAEEAGERIVRQVDLRDGDGQRSVFHHLDHAWLRIFGLASGQQKGGTRTRFGQCAGAKVGGVERRVEATAVGDSEHVARERTHEDSDTATIADWTKVGDSVGQLRIPPLVADIARPEAGVNVHSPDGHHTQRLQRILDGDEVDVVSELLQQECDDRCRKRRGEFRHTGRNIRQTDGRCNTSGFDDRCGAGIEVRVRVAYS